MRRCSLLRNNRFGAELRDVFGLSFPAPLISRLLSVGSVSVLLFPISVFFVITTEDFSVVCFIGSDCSTVSFRLSSPCSEISGITPPTFHPPAYRRRSCVRDPLSGTAPDVGCRRRHNLRPRPVRTAHRSRRLFIRHLGIIIGRDDISNAVRIGFVGKFYLFVMLSAVFRHI